VPYIAIERRQQLDAAIDHLAEQIKQLPHQDLRDLDGDVNYSVTKLILAVFDLAQAPKYSKFNSAVGALECIKQELYRRFTAPYEDQKMRDNGDI